MEWVETTGRTVEEAKDAALDQLGVDEVDAEFEIVDEAKAGLFGRLRREARVRGRIRPTSPRPKNDRRDRRRRSSSRPDKASRSPRGGDRKASSSDGGERGKDRNRAVATADRRGGDEGTGGARGPGGGRRRSRGGRNRSGGPSEGTNRAGQDRHDPENPDKGEAAMTEVTLEEQAEIVEEFLDGLVDAFDLDGDVRSERIDEDTLEVQVNGDDLGLLIGPKGQTLAAIQELSRTIVQRKSQGTSAGRLRLDVAGYRQRRREALERFTRSIADEVKAAGVQKALEPMGSADRKVVHDTVNDLDGVSTVSEGEEPRRRVVIIPEG
jgi:spoIIIJ-associated protein